MIKVTIGIRRRSESFLLGSYSSFILAISCCGNPVLSVLAYLLFCVSFVDCTDDAASSL